MFTRLRSILQNFLKGGDEYTPPGRKLKNTSIPSYLYISLTPRNTDLEFQSEGEYPRRVQAGEVIARGKGLLVRAPFAGLARLAEGIYGIQIKPDGGMKFGASRITEEDSPSSRLMAMPAGDRETFQHFLHELEDSGIPFLLSGYQAFRGVIEKMIQSGSMCIILSDADPDGALCWKDIWKNHPDLLQSLVGLFEHVLPQDILAGIHVHEEECHDDHARDFARKLPEVIVSRSPFSSRFKPGPPLADQGILFLQGPAIFALYEYFFLGRWYDSRLLSFRFHRKLKEASTNESREWESVVYRLPNGYPLDDPILMDYENRFGKLVGLEGDIFGDDTELFTQEHFHIFHIYGRGAIHLMPPEVREKRKQTAPCNGCGRCQEICPTGASPLSLLAGDKNYFISERCVQCGLCEYACASHIPLLSVSGL